MKHLSVLLVTALAITAPCLSHAGAQEPAHAAAHRSITTRSPDAQAAFDRGLVMLYAFNMGEARLAFARAAQIDPECAAAYWAGALTRVSDINQTPSRDDEHLAGALLVRASRAREASSQERELVAALRLRFNDPAHADAETSAYLAAMRRYTAAHPDDADAHVHTAIAMWQQQIPDVSHTMPQLGRQIDLALKADPANLGAHHMRIHYEEGIGRPRAALADADLLAGLQYDLGESHLPHMAGHIYLHIGAYEQAARANMRALENDRRYFSAGNGAGRQYMQFYHHHVLDNLFYAMTTIGENRQAQAIAREETGMERRIEEAALAARTRDPRPVDCSRNEDDDESLAAAITAIRRGDTHRAHACGVGLDAGDRTLLHAVQAGHDGRYAVAAAPLRKTLCAL